MKPHEWKWRYAILVCDCLFVIGVYFSIDIPSSLQVDFVLSEKMRCHANQTMVTGACCDTCLGLGSQRYNMLYAIVYFTASVLSLPAGYVIDRIGNRVSAVLIITLVSSGVCLFAMAGSPLLRYTSAMFPIMLIGRMLLGFANGPMGLVQERVIAHWFGGDSVLALSLLFVTRRCGSLLNFLVTANIAVHFGFYWSLWVGAIFCSFGVIVAILMANLDLRGTKQLDAEALKQMASRPIKITDIANIPKTYWIFVSMMALYYCSFHTFITNATQYIQLRYGYTKVMASYVMATTCTGSIVFAPFVAIFLKRMECNGLVATAVSTLVIPIYLLLAFCPTIPPVVLVMAITAITTFDTILTWQVSIELLPPAVYGTGAGIGMFVIRCSIGLTSLAVGAIIEETHDQDQTEQIHAYQNALLLMAASSVLSVTCGILLNVLDLRNGDGVNKRFIKDKPVAMTDTTELVVADKLSKLYTSNGTVKGTLEEH